MTKYGMAIDTKRCVACNRCSMACKIEHNLPLGMLWNRALYNGADYLLVPQGTYEEGLKTEMYTLACQHCDNPECVSVCPTGASYKAEDGTVQVDMEKCIGCKYCMAACPYQVRVRNEETGAVDKCRFCTVSAETSGTQMCSCVEACLTGARIFGDLDDPASDISKEIAATNAQPIAGDLTKSKVFYVR